MTSRELAEEFTDLWDELGVPHINEMLAKNVSVELLEFFVEYAGQLGSELEGEELKSHLPNLLVIGYLIRLLEERVE